MKNSKHIVVACNYTLKADRIGGMDRFFKAFNNQLVKQGHRVSWFFSGGEPIEYYSGLEVHFARNGYLERDVIKYLEKQEQVDVLVTHFMELCTPFYKIAKERGVAHIIAVDHNPRPIKGFPLKKRIRNRLKGLLFSRFIDQFVGVSGYTRTHILKDYGNFLGKKTKVIYNGIDTNQYLKRVKENKGKFIVASHLRESKGIRDLIEAVHQLPENLKKQMTIDIYGEGPLEVFLKEKAVDLGLGQQFRFLGSSPNLPSLFHEYSYLLQPTYMECFSLSILESLSANVPVVTTPVGGNPEIIVPYENGFLFPAGDVSQLSALLQKILLGELKIDREVNRKVEEDFNLKKMVSEHIELLPL